MRTALSTPNVGGRTWILVAALCAATFVSAAQNGTLRLHGVRPAFETELLQSLRSLPVERDDSSLISAVRAWYEARGFLRFAVDSLYHRTTDTIDLWVKEGKPCVIDSLNVTGVLSDLENAMGDRWMSRIGGPFSPAILEDDIRGALQLLESRGRLLAAVRVADVREEERDEAFGYRIELAVDPGPVVLLGQVQFAGNVATRNSALAMASGLRPGVPWTEKAGDRARRSLERTQLFTSVSAPVVTLGTDRRAHVSYTVVEGRHNSFDGIVGYLPPASGRSSGSLMGMVQVKFKNLLGTARRLGVRWFQERRGTQEVEISYREPWVAGWPIAAEVGLFQRKQDSTYVRQQFGLDVRGDVLDDISVGVTLNFSSTTPQEGYGKRVLSGSSVTLAGITFVSDGRDDPVTPMSGSMFATDVRAGRKKVSSPSGVVIVSEQQLRFDAAAYVRTATRQVFVTELHAKEVRNGSLDIGDLFRVGGATSLRGYGEGEFLGSKVVWGTAEYRVLVAPRSFASVFVDGGAIIHPAIPDEGVASSNVSRIGYGIGLRLDAPVGLIGLSIALGKGDSFGDAKLHLRLINEF